VLGKHRTDKRQAAMAYYYIITANILLFVHEIYFQ